MAEEFSVDDLVEIPTGQLSDDDKNRLDGTKTKIAKVSVKEKDSIYKDGERLPDGQTVKTMVAVLETESIGINALGQPITVAEEFSLKQHPVSKKWGPSMHEKSKAKKLFNKLKVNNFKECVGRDIVVVKKVSETNANKTWLGFSI
jgi:hypothetical protein